MRVSCSASKKMKPSRCLTILHQKSTLPVQTRNSMGDPLIYKRVQKLMPNGTYRSPAGCQCGKKQFVRIRLHKRVQNISKHVARITVTLETHWRIAQRERASGVHINPRWKTQYVGTSSSSVPQGSIITLAVVFLSLCILPHPCLLAFGPGLY